MRNETKHIVVSILLPLILFSGLVASILIPDKEVSVWERRKLKQLPSADQSFFSEFEDYTMDQFPFRDAFRSLSSATRLWALGMKDSHGLYLAGRQIGKIEYPMDEKAVGRALHKINALRSSLPSSSKAYFALIPDKNYYLAQRGGYPCMDYEALFQICADSLEDISYIPLEDCLSIGDFYRTDTHWRQERLGKVVDRLRDKMRLPFKFSDTDYDMNTYEPFQGVLYGQLALPVSPERMYYLTSPAINETMVYNLETGSTGGVYETRLQGRYDPYDLFLYGASSLLVLENPNASASRELVLFRDSFGSSLAPLLLENYSKITMVDLRYLASAYVDQFVTIDGQTDVLFLFSSLILNSGDVIK